MKLIKDLIDAVKIIIAEWRNPLKAPEYKDLRPLIIAREKKKLAGICDTKKAEQFALGIKSIAGMSGITPWAIFAHAWHESGGFRRVIGKHNYWGIKKPRSWTGKVVAVKTHEFIDRVRVNVTADFIDFEALPQAIFWYVDFLNRMYPRAVQNGHEPEAFFLGLVIGKFQYATDPNYVSKLTRLYKALKKNIWLKELLK